jgi:hypothetical protein
MTRAEYLKYFARNARGEYVGTAPEEEGIEIWREKLGLGPRRTGSVFEEKTDRRGSEPVRSMST